MSRFFHLLVASLLVISLIPIDVAAADTLSDSAATPEQVTLPPVDMVSPNNEMAAAAPANDTISSTPVVTELEQVADIPIALENTTKSTIETAVVATPAPSIVTTVDLRQRRMCWYLQ